MQHVTNVEIKRSPQTVSRLYVIRLHTKKPRYQKLHGAITGGGRPLGSATGSDAKRMYSGHIVAVIPAVDLDYRSANIYLLY